MNPAVLVALRGIALLFNLHGQEKLAAGLLTLANGYEAGADVDAHMKGVAEALKSGGPLDWEAVADRIEADSARLHGNG